MFLLFFSGFSQILITSQGIDKDLKNKTNKSSFQNNLQVTDTLSEIVTYYDLVY